MVIQVTWVEGNCQPSMAGEMGVVDVLHGFPDHEAVRRNTPPGVLASMSCSIAAVCHAITVENCCCEVGRAQS